MNTGGAKILPAAVSLNIYPEFSFKSHSFFNEHIYKSVNCPLFIEFIYIYIILMSFFFFYDVL